MKNLFQNRWFLLIVLSLTWGSSFILIKKSLMVFSPYQIGAARVAISGILLIFIGWPALKRMSRKIIWWVAVTGFFANFFPMFLFPLAQTRISSSMAGILDSLVPLFVLLLGFVLFGIRSRRIQVGGALVGFLGAALLMYFSQGNIGQFHLGFALLAVLATVCYAFAALLVKAKLEHVPSMDISGAVFTIWLLPALIILYFSDFFTLFQESSEAWTAMGYLGILSVVGTAIAIVLYYKLIQDTSAVFASSVTYLLPLIAVLWGVLDGEEFTIWYVIGGFLILLGIYLIEERDPTD